MKLDLTITRETETFLWRFNNGLWKTNHAVDSVVFDGGNDYELFKIILEDIQAIHKEMFKRDFKLVVDNSEGRDCYSVNGIEFNVDWGDCLDYPYTTNVWFSDLCRFLREELDITLKINVK